MMAASDKYQVRVFWSDEDAAFVAVVPELPGCSAVGDSRAQAFVEIGHAIEAWIEAAQAAGNPIPAPHQYHAQEDYSGRILLRLPKSLHAALAEQAASEGVSLNQHLVSQLSIAATVGCVKQFLDTTRIVMVAPAATDFRRIVATSSALTSTGTTAGWGSGNKYNG